MEEYRKKLEDELQDGLYEISVGGHIALIGKKGYIDWLVSEKTICDVLKIEFKGDNGK